MDTVCVPPDVPKSRTTWMTCSFRALARTQGMSFPKQMRKTAEQHLVVLYHKSKSTVSQFGTLGQRFIDGLGFAP
jgi:hypothetical protein